MVDKNWINAYVSKIAGKHFELVLIQDIIGSFIEMLNVKLNDNQ
ncbi:hypothetical protein V7088_27805 [Priestia megaterium]